MCVCGCVCLREFSDSFSTSFLATLYVGEPFILVLQWLLVAMNTHPSCEELQNDLFIYILILFHISVMDAHLYLSPGLSIWLLVVKINVIGFV